MSIFKVLAENRDQYEVEFEIQGLANHAEAPVQTPRRLRKYGGGYDRDVVTLFALWCGYCAHYQLVMTDATKRRDTVALARHITSLHNFVLGLHRFVDQDNYVCVPSSSSDSAFLPFRRPV